MALAINVASTDWGTNYVDQAVPYLSSAIGYYLFGGTQALTIINHAPGATVNMTPVGTATYSEGYASMVYNTQYFNTGINVTNDSTIIVVADNISGDDYYAKTSSTGILMGKHSGTQGRYSSAFGPTCIATFSPGTLFGFLAGTTVGTVGSPFIMYSGRDGTLTATSNGSLAADLAASQVILGPSGQFSAGVGHKMAAAMIFDSVLNASQLDEIYEYFRFKLPKRGILLA